MWIWPYKRGVIVFIFCGHNAILELGGFKSPMRDIQFRLSQETDRDELGEINGNVCVQQITEEFH